MRGKGEKRSGRRAVVYCIVPRELAAKLHEPLWRHFRDDPEVEVIVERRARDRRSGRERRSGAAERASAERRKVRNTAGRRVGDRRASLVAVVPPELPRRARPHADRLVFVERLEPAGERAEDLDTARLVMRIQAGDRDAFADLYMRYFDRVYSYLRVALRDVHEAEDLTQQVFADVLEALPRYERRGQPFRAWLFRIVRNNALMYLRKDSRLDVLDPAEVNNRRELAGAAAEAEAELGALDWIADSDLLIFIERLPLAQRQALLLRYLLGLTSAEVGEILNLKPDHVRVLQSRAVRFLKERLTALGRGPKQGDRARMRRVGRQALVARSRRYALLKH